jgi:hypothetical protein
MLRRLAFLASFVAIVACRAGTAPETGPEGAPDFRGVIAHITDDGLFRIDDGSGTACGFSHVRVPDAAEIRWRFGGRATRAALRIGRHVSVWQPEEQRGFGSARCQTIDARLIVIENVAAL